MKTKMIILNLIILFVFSLDRMNAQIELSNDVFESEWTYSGPECITMKDTIILSKDLRNKTEQTKEWIFKENGEFSIYIRTDEKMKNKKSLYRKAIRGFMMMNCRY
ncbi:MAG: hypothetical protein HC906_05560 [Bacteroidales bacterium]|nr:hypothetical protein [Bacteroidales bacterium]